jgi:hypothetical protein
MGTPKFSLKVAALSLLPYIESLSFQQDISRFVGNRSFSWRIDGRDYIFDHFRAHTMMSAVLWEKPMLHAIPICNDVIFRVNGRVHQVTERRLLVQRTNTHIYNCSWFYQITKYIPVPGRDTMTNHLYSVASSIIWLRYDDESKQDTIHLPQDFFDVGFRKHLSEWADESIKPREKSVTNLRNLQKLVTDSGDKRA